MKIKHGHKERVWLMNDINNLLIDQPTYQIPDCNIEAC